MSRKPVFSIWVKATAYLLCALLLTETAFCSAPAPLADILRSAQIASHDGVKVESLVEKIQIPSSLGSIQEVFQSPVAGRLSLVHLEDAHGEPEAQKNTQAILEHLQKKYGIQTFFLEGAWSKLEPALLQLSKNSDENKKILEELTEKGVVGGPENFLYGKKGTQGFGIEDLDLYKKNIDQFRTVISAKKESDTFLNEMKSGLLTKASQVLSPELAAYFRDWSFHEEVESDYTAHLRALRENAKKHLALDLGDAREQYDWPMLVRFQKLKELEKSSAAFNSEEEKRFRVWLEKYSLGLPAEAARSDFEAFYEKAAPLGFKFKDYPGLSKQWGKQILAQELDAPLLIKEIQSLENKLIEKLAQTADEKKFIQKYREYLLLKKLLHLELSRTEWRGLDLSVASVPAPYGAIIKNAQAFYQTAEARDTAMLKRTIDWIKKEKIEKAAIITGGFHSEGLGNLFKQKNISYLRVQPRITQIHGRENYLKFMMAAPTTSEVDTSEVVGGAAHLRLVSAAEPRPFEPQPWRVEYRGASGFTGSMPVVFVGDKRRAEIRELGGRAASDSSPGKKTHWNLGTEWDALLGAFQVPRHYRHADGHQKEQITNRHSMIEKEGLKIIEMGANRLLGGQVSRSIESWVHRSASKLIVQYAIRLTDSEKFGLIRFEIENDAVTVFVKNIILNHEGAFYEGENLIPPFVAKGDRAKPEHISLFIDPDTLMTGLKFPEEIREKISLRLSASDLDETLDVLFDQFLHRSEMRALKPQERSELIDANQAMVDFLAVREIYSPNSLEPKAINEEQLLARARDLQVVMIFGSTEEMSIPPMIETLRKLKKINPEIKIIISGSNGLHDGVHEDYRDENGKQITPAEYFKRQIEMQGVPVDWIEPYATNSSENILFSQAFLKTKGLDPTQILIIQNPYGQKRAGATFLRQSGVLTEISSFVVGWLFRILPAELNKLLKRYVFRMTQADARSFRSDADKWSDESTTLINYAPYVPDFSQSGAWSDEDLLLWAKRLAGEVDRLQKYPNEPYRYIVPVSVSSQVMDAAETAKQIMLANERFEMRSGILPVKTQYAHAGLRGLTDKNAESILVNVATDLQSNLWMMPWAQRSSDPFTAEEIRKFEEGIGLEPDFDPSRHVIKRVRHTFYNRSRGEIEIWVAVQDGQDQEHYFLQQGTNSGAMEKLQAMKPFISQLKPEGVDVALQVSLGNQGDVPGNFTLLSDGKGWKFFGAVDEPWANREYRALVEMNNGRRLIGAIRLQGKTDSNQIASVYFKSAEQDAAEIQLNPEDIRFALVAYALGWGNMPVRELLAEQYTKFSDLRHIFAFPFFNGRPVLWREMLAQNAEENIRKAFAQQALLLPVDPALRDDLIKQLGIYGYQPRDKKEEVRKAGDYFLNEDTIEIIFLPAVYPVNGLAISRDGINMAFVTVPGQSGKVGAHYENIFDWTRDQIIEKFGWEPHVFFAFDNGQDPQMVSYASGEPEVLVGSVSNRPLNAALNLQLAPRSEMRRGAGSETIPRRSFIVRSSLGLAWAGLVGLAGQSAMLLQAQGSPELTSWLDENQPWKVFTHVDPNERNERAAFDQSKEFTLRTLEWMINNHLPHQAELKKYRDLFDKISFSPNGLRGAIFGKDFEGKKVFMNFQDTKPFYSAIQELNSSNLFSVLMATLEREALGLAMLQSAGFRQSLKNREQRRQTLIRSIKDEFGERTPLWPNVGAERFLKREDISSGLREAFLSQISGETYETLVEHEVLQLLINRGYLSLEGLKTDVLRANARYPDVKPADPNFLYLDTNVERLVATKGDLKGVLAAQLKTFDGQFYFYKKIPTLTHFLAYLFFFGQRDLYVRTKGAQGVDPLVMKLFSMDRPVDSHYYLSVVNDFFEEVKKQIELIEEGLPAAERLLPRALKRSEMRTNKTVKKASAPRIEENVRKLLADFEANRAPMMEIVERFEQKTFKKKDIAAFKKHVKVLLRAVMNYEDMEGHLHPVEDVIANNLDGVSVPLIVLRKSGGELSPDDAFKLAKQMRATYKQLDALRLIVDAGKLSQIQRFYRASSAFNVSSLRAEMREGILKTAAVLTGAVMLILSGRVTEWTDSGFWQQAIRFGFFTAATFVLNITGAYYMYRAKQDPHPLREAVKFSWVVFRSFEIAFFILKPWIASFDWFVSKIIVNMAWEWPLNILFSYLLLRDKGASRAESWQTAIKEINATFLISQKIWAPTNIFLYSVPFLAEIFLPAWAAVYFGIYGLPILSAIAVFFVSPYIGKLIQEHFKKIGGRSQVRGQLAEDLGASRLVQAVDSDGEPISEFNADEDLAHAYRSEMRGVWDRAVRKFFDQYGFTRGTQLLKAWNLAMRGRMFRERLNKAKDITGIEQALQARKQQVSVRTNGIILAGLFLVFPLLVFFRYGHGLAGFFLPNYAASALFIVTGVFILFKFLKLPAREEAFDFLIDQIKEGEREIQQRAHAEQQEIREQRREALREAFEKRDIKILFLDMDGNLALPLTAVSGRAFNVLNRLLALKREIHILTAAPIGYAQRQMLEPRAIEASNRANFKVATESGGVVATMNQDGQIQQQVAADITQDHVLAVKQALKDVLGAELGQGPYPDFEDHFPSALGKTTLGFEFLDDFYRNLALRKKKKLESEFKKLAAQGVIPRVPTITISSSALDISFFRKGDYVHKILSARDLTDADALTSGDSVGRHEGVDGGDRSMFVRVSGERRNKVMRSIDKFSKKTKTGIGLYSGPEEARGLPLTEGFYFNPVEGPEGTLEALEILADVLEEKRRGEMRAVKETVTASRAENREIWDQAIRAVIELKAETGKREALLEALEKVLKDEDVVRLLGKAQTLKEVVDAIHMFSSRLAAKLFFKTLILLCLSSAFYFSGLFEYFLSFLKPYPLLSVGLFVGFISAVLLAYKYVPAIVSKKLDAVHELSRFIVDYASEVRDELSKTAQAHGFQPQNQPVSGKAAVLRTEARPVGFFIKRIAQDLQSSILELQPNISDRKRDILKLEEIATQLQEAKTPAELFVFEWSLIKDLEQTIREKYPDIKNPLEVKAREIKLVQKDATYDFVILISFYYELASLFEQYTPEELGYEGKVSELQEIRTHLLHNLSIEAKWSTPLNLRPLQKVLQQALILLLGATELDAQLAPQRTIAEQFVWEAISGFLRLNPEGFQINSGSEQMIHFELRLIERLRQVLPGLWIRGQEQIKTIIREISGSDAKLSEYEMGVLTRQNLMSVLRSAAVTDMKPGYFELIQNLTMIFVKSTTKAAVERLKDEHVSQDEVFWDFLAADWLGRAIESHFQNQNNHLPAAKRVSFPAWERAAMDAEFVEDVSHFSQTDTIRSYADLQAALRAFGTGNHGETLTQASLAFENFDDRHEAGRRLKLIAQTFRIYALHHLDKKNEAAAETQALFEIIRTDPDMQVFFMLPQDILEVLTSYTVRVNVKPLDWNGSNEALRRLFDFQGEYSTRPDNHEDYLNAGELISGWLPLVESEVPDENLVLRFEILMRQWVRQHEYHAMLIFPELIERTRNPQLKTRLSQLKEELINPLMGEGRAASFSDVSFFSGYLNALSLEMKTVALSPFLQHQNGFFFAQGVKHDFEAEPLLSVMSEISKRLSDLSGTSGDATRIVTNQSILSLVLNFSELIDKQAAAGFQVTWPRGWPSLLLDLSRGAAAKKTTESEIDNSLEFIYKTISAIGVWLRSQPDPDQAQARAILEAFRPAFKNALGVLNPYLAKWDTRKDKDRLDRTFRFRLNLVAQYLTLLQAAGNKEEIVQHQILWGEWIQHLILQSGGTTRFVSDHVPARIYQSMQILSRNGAHLVMPIGIMTAETQFLSAYALWIQEADGTDTSDLAFSAHINSWQSQTNDSQAAVLAIAARPDESFRDDNLPQSIELMIKTEAEIKALGNDVPVHLTDGLRQRLEVIQKRNPAQFTLWEARRLIFSGEKQTGLSLLAGLSGFETGMLRILAEANEDNKEAMADILSRAVLELSQKGVSKEVIAAKITHFIFSLPEAKRQELNQVLLGLLKGASSVVRDVIFEAGLVISGGSLAYFASGQLYEDSSFKNAAQELMDAETGVIEDARRLKAWDNLVKRFEEIAGDAGASDPYLTMGMQLLVLKLKSKLRPDHPILRKTKSVTVWEASNRKLIQKLLNAGLIPFQMQALYLFGEYEYLKSAIKNDLMACAATFDIKPLGILADSRARGAAASLEKRSAVEKLYAKAQTADELRNVIEAAEVFLDDFNSRDPAAKSIQRNARRLLDLPELDSNSASSVLELIREIPGNEWDEPIRKRYEKALGLETNRVLQSEGIRAAGEFLETERNHDRGVALLKKELAAMQKHLDRAQETLSQNLPDEAEKQLAEFKARDQTALQYASSIKEAQELKAKIDAEKQKISQVLDIVRGNGGFQLMREKVLWLFNYPEYRIKSLDAVSEAARFFFDSGMDADLTPNKTESKTYFEKVYFSGQLLYELIAELQKIDSGVPLDEYKKRADIMISQSAARIWLPELVSSYFMVSAAWHAEEAKRIYGTTAPGQQIQGPRSLGFRKAVRGKQDLSIRISGFWASNAEIERRLREGDLVRIRPATADQANKTVNYFTVAKIEGDMVTLKPEVAEADDDVEGQIPSDKETPEQMIENLLGQMPPSETRPAGYLDWVPNNKLSRQKKHLESILRRLDDSIKPELVWAGDHARTADTGSDIMNNLLGLRRWSTTAVIPSKKDEIRKLAEDFQALLKELDPQGKAHGLDLPQLEAILITALDDAPFAFFHGPPGTGKTESILWLIKVLQNRHQSVRVYSHANRAVDNVLRRILGFNRKVDAYLDRKDGTTKRELRERESFKGRHMISMARGGNNGTAVHPDIEPFWADKDNILNKMNSTLWSLVAGTIDGLPEDSSFNKQKADAVIVDEAGQFTLPDVLVAAMENGSEKRLSKLVLVGDPDQLPAYGFSSSEAHSFILNLVDTGHLQKWVEEISGKHQPGFVREVFSKLKGTGDGKHALDLIFEKKALLTHRVSLFKKAIDFFYDPHFYSADIFPTYQPPYFFFNIQRRSGKRSVMIQNYHYKGRLVAGNEHDEGVVIEVDTRGQAPQESTALKGTEEGFGSNKSLYNPMEADAVLDWIGNLINQEKVPAAHIGVLAPYKGQVLYLEQAVKGFSALHSYLKTIAFPEERGAQEASAEDVEELSQLFGFKEALKNRLNRKAGLREIFLQFEKDAENPAIAKRLLAALSLGEEFVPWSMAKHDKFHILTVDSAIGSEFDAVIVSWALSNREGKLGFLVGEEDGKPRRNVGTSRDGGYKSVKTSYAVMIGDRETFKRNTDVEIRKWYAHTWGLYDQFRAEDQPDAVKRARWDFADKAFPVKGSRAEMRKVTSEEAAMDRAVRTHEIYFDMTRSVAAYQAAKGAGDAPKQRKLLRAMKAWERTAAALKKEIRFKDAESQAKAKEIVQMKSVQLRDAKQEIETKYKLIREKLLAAEWSSDEQSEFRQLSLKAINLLKLKVLAHWITFTQALQNPVRNQNQFGLILFGLLRAYSRIAAHHAGQKRVDPKAFLEALQMVVTPQGTVEETLDYSRAPFARIRFHADKTVTIAKRVWKYVDVQGGPEALIAVWVEITLNSAITGERLLGHEIEWYRADYAALMQYRFMLDRLIDEMDTWVSRKHPDDNKLPQETSDSIDQILSLILEGVSVNGGKIKHGMKRKFTQLLARKNTDVEALPKPGSSLKQARIFLKQASENSLNDLPLAAAALKQALMWIDFRLEDIAAKNAGVERELYYLQKKRRQQEVRAALSKMWDALVSSQRTAESVKTAVDEIAVLYEKYYRFVIRESDFYHEQIQMSALRASLRPLEHMREGIPPAQIRGIQKNITAVRAALSARSEMRDVWPEAEALEQRFFSSNPLFHLLFRGIETDVSADALTVRFKFNFRRRYHTVQAMSGPLKHDWTVVVHVRKDGRPRFSFEEFPDTWIEVEGLYDGMKSFLLDVLSKKGFYEVDLREKPQTSSHVKSYRVQSHADAVRVLQRINILWKTAFHLFASRGNDYKAWMRAILEEHFGNGRGGVLLRSGPSGVGKTSDDQNMDGIIGADHNGRPRRVPFIGDWFLIPKTKRDAAEEMANRARIGLKNEWLFWHEDHINEFLEKARSFFNSNQKEELVIVIRNAWHRDAIKQEQVETIPEQFDHEINLPGDPQAKHYDDGRQHYLTRVVRLTRESILDVDSKYAGRYEMAYRGKHKGKKLADLFLRYEDDWRAILAKYSRRKVFEELVAKEYVVREILAEHDTSRDEIEAALDPKYAEGEEFRKQFGKALRDKQKLLTHELLVAGLRMIRERGLTNQEKNLITNGLDRYLMHFLVSYEYYRDTMYRNDIYANWVIDLRHTMARDLLREINLILKYRQIDDTTPVIVADAFARERLAHARQLMLATQADLRMGVNKWYDQFLSFLKSNYTHRRPQEKDRLALQMAGFVGRSVFGTLAQESDREGTQILGIQQDWFRYYLMGLNDISSSKLIDGLVSGKDLLQTFAMIMALRMVQYLEEKTSSVSQRQEMIQPRKYGRLYQEFWQELIEKTPSGQVFPAGESRYEYGPKPINWDSPDERMGAANSDLRQIQIEQRLLGKRNYIRVLGFKVYWGWLVERIEWFENVANQIAGWFSKKERYFVWAYEDLKKIQQRTLIRKDDFEPYFRRFIEMIMSIDEPAPDGETDSPEKRAELRSNLKLRVSWLAEAKLTGADRDYIVSLRNPGYFDSNYQIEVVPANEWPRARKNEDSKGYLQADFSGAGVLKEGAWTVVISPKRQKAMLWLLKFVNEKLQGERRSFEAKSNHWADIEQFDINKPGAIGLSVSEIWSVLSGLNQSAWEDNAYLSGSGVLGAQASIRETFYGNQLAFLQSKILALFGMVGSSRIVPQPRQAILSWTEKDWQEFWMPTIEQSRDLLALPKLSRSGSAQNPQSSAEDNRRSFGQFAWEAFRDAAEKKRVTHVRVRSEKRDSDLAPVKKFVTAVTSKDTRRVLNDAADNEAAWLVMYDPAKDTFLTSAFKSLSATKPLIIFVSSKPIKDNLLHWFAENKPGQRVFIYNTEKYISSWARDRVLAVVTSQGPKIILPKLKKNTRDPLRQAALNAAEDYFNAAGVAVEKSDVIFEGGNILSNGEDIFVGENMIEENMRENGWTETQVREQIARLLGSSLPIYTIQDPFNYHLDSFMTLLPGKKVVVGDPKLGVEQVETDPNQKAVEHLYAWHRDDLEDPRIVSFEKTRALTEKYQLEIEALILNLQHQGFMVQRVPLILGRLGNSGKSAYPIVSYNNVLIEGNKVLLPWYDIAADAYAKRIFEGLGYQVEALGSATAAMIDFGCARCLFQKIFLGQIDFKVLGRLRNASETQEPASMPESAGVRPELRVHSSQGEWMTHQSNLAPQMNREKQMAVARELTEGVFSVSYVDTMSRSEFRASFTRYFGAGQEKFVIQELIKDKKELVLLSPALVLKKGFLRDKKIMGNQPFAVFAEDASQRKEILALLESEGFDSRQAFVVQTEAELNTQIGLRLKTSGSARKLVLTSQDDSLETIKVMRQMGDHLPLSDIAIRLLYQEFGLEALVKQVFGARQVLTAA